LAKPHWNGLAVFTCTRAVAEAIIADQQHARAIERDRLTRTGLTAAIDDALAPMWFDGDHNVVDERALYGDEEGLSRIAPDGDGLYVVNGWRWTWEALDPAVFDQIVGVIPPAGSSRCSSSSCTPRCGHCTIGSPSPPCATSSSPAATPRPQCSDSTDAR